MVGRAHARRREGGREGGGKRARAEGSRHRACEVLEGTGLRLEGSLCLYVCLYGHGSY